MCTECQQLSSSHETPSYPSRERTPTSTVEQPALLHWGNWEYLTLILATVKNARNFIRVTLESNRLTLVLSITLSLQVGRRVQDG